MRAGMREGKHEDGHTVPAKGQRTEIENKENIRDDFGDAWEKAEGEGSNGRGMGEG